MKALRNDGGAMGFSAPPQNLPSFPCLIIYLQVRAMGSLRLDCLFPRVLSYGWLPEENSPCDIFKSGKQLARLGCGEGGSMGVGSLFPQCV